MKRKTRRGGLHIKREKGFIKTRDSLKGVYRARVESRKDPLHLGRVRVRIPMLHGIPEVTESFIETEYLPWASRSAISAGYDMGSFIVPQVGSWVYVLWEGDDPKKLIYFGGVHGNLGSKEHTFGYMEDEFYFNVDEVDSDLIPAGQWKSPAGENEIPKDVFYDKDHDEPTRDIIYKSLKGHTVMSEEEDEKESFSIIDRAGQIFRFLCPVKEDINRSGDESFKRGVKDTVKEDQFDYENQLVNSKAVIFLKDLASQVFRMVAEYGNEKIEFISRNLDKTRRSLIGLFSGEEDVKILLLSEEDDESNHTYIEMDSSNTVIRSGVVSEGSTVAKKTMSDEEVLNQSWDIPYKIEAYPYVGPGMEVGWEDKKDEDLNN